MRETLDPEAVKDVKESASFIEMPVFKVCVMANGHLAIQKRFKTEFAEDDQFIALLTELRHRVIRMCGFVAGGGHTTIDL